MTTLIPAPRRRPQASAASVARIAGASSAAAAVVLGTSFTAASAISHKDQGSKSGLFTPRVAPEKLDSKSQSALREFVSSTSPAQWWRWWNEDTTRSGYYFGTGRELNSFMANGSTTTQSQRLSSALPYVDPSAGRQLWRYWNDEKKVSGLFTGTGAQLNVFLNSYFGGASLDASLKKAQSSRADVQVQPPRSAAPKAPVKTAPVAPKPAVKAPVQKPAAPVVKAPVAPQPVTPKAPVAQKPTAPAPVAKTPVQKPTAPVAKAPVTPQAPVAKAPVAPVVKAPAQKAPATKAPATATKNYVDNNAGAQWWEYWDAKKNKGLFYGTGKQANIFLNIFLTTGDKAAGQAAAAKLGPITPPVSAPPKASTPKAPAPSAPKPAAPSASKNYVDNNAGAQWWEYWDAKKNKGLFYGTGKQANIFLNIFLTTGDKAAGQAAAAKLGPITPPASTTPKAPVAPKPSTPSTPPSKNYVDNNAGAQWWSYWDGNGAKGSFYGTGRQANVFLNIFLTTGDKAAAQAAAAKLGPITPPATTPSAPSVPTTPAGTDSNTNRNYTYPLNSSAATGAYGTAPSSLVASMNLRQPVSGQITSWYGQRCLPGFSACDNHTGMDFAAPTGTPVGAAQSGRVIFAGWHAYGGGYRVEVDHGNGVVTTYSHLSSINVSVGQLVTQGQNIGGVGSTGNSTGPHLHLEVIVNGAWTNPAPWLRLTAA